MRSGVWLHYPYSGGAWEQDEVLMTLVQQAWRSWYVFGYKPKNKMAWDDDDAEYIEWVAHGDD
jgi:hypothetical protein